MSEKKHIICHLQNSIGVPFYRNTCRSRHEWGLTGQRRSVWLGEPGPEGLLHHVPRHHPEGGPPDPALRLHPVRGRLSRPGRLRQPQLQEGCLLPCNGKTGTEARCPEAASARGQGEGNPYNRSSHEKELAPGRVRRSLDPSQHHVRV